MQIDSRVGESWLSVYVKQTDYNRMAQHLVSQDSRKRRRYINKRLGKNSGCEKLKNAKPYSVLLK